MFEFDYTSPGPVASRFMKSNALVRGLRGPVASGKSVAASVDCFKRSLAQDMNNNQLARTRGVIVRNTYAELRTTTMKTWSDWFPEEQFGKIKYNPPPYLHHIRKGFLDMEVYFLALDREEDVKKVLSMELTWAWVNEAREVPKSIIDALSMRIGRFPSMRDGGPSWYGVIMDTNAPDEDHWWPIMAGEVPAPDWMTAEERKNLVTPPDWEFYTQPPAMIEDKNELGEVEGYHLNPERENKGNVTPNYYQNIIQGKSKSWINVYVLNKYGGIIDGKPVYPEFSRDAHVAREPIIPNPGVVYVGVDFGLTPSAVFGQLVRGRWLILHEVVATDMGAKRFGQLCATEASLHFPGMEVRGWGDPAGDHRAQTDEQTPFQVIKAAGFPLMKAPSNDPALRIESVKNVLNRMVDGKPGFMVDPECLSLIKGFETGYKYRRLKVSGEKYETSPDKNRFSHVHDALQYLLMGAGEGRKLTNTGTQNPVNAKGKPNVMAHRALPRGRRRAQ